MKQTKADKHRRAKAIGVAAAALVLGIGLLVARAMLLESGARAAAASATQASSAPTDAEATDTQPASTTPARQRPKTDPKVLANQRMGNLLLLFSLLSFGVLVTAVGWVFYDIRRSRPAWKTQTKYPVHQKANQKRK